MLNFQVDHHTPSDAIFIAFHGVTMEKYLLSIIRLYETEAAIMEIVGDVSAYQTSTPPN